MGETATKSLESNAACLLRFSQAIVGVDDFRGDLTVSVQPGPIREMVVALKSDGYSMLMDLFAMDYLKWEPETPERFAVVYHFYSLVTKKRVRLKAWVPDETPTIDSIHDLFKAANWFEREAWDLFGVVFRGHPNLHRILCHTDFEGHPLRKDYPADKYQRLKSVAPSVEI